MSSAFSFHYKPCLSKIFILVFAISLFSSTVGAVEPGQLSPDFTLRSNSNGVVKLSQYRGKIVLLDFWASWCEPCKESLPWMHSLQEKLGAEKFQVIAVSVDSEMTAADALLKATGVDLLVAYDPEGSVPAMYQLDAMPTSFLIDAQGKVVEIYHGYHRRDARKVEERVRQLLNL